MTDVAQQRPDVEAVLRGLKDFQRRTVDYAFNRLYEDPDSNRRFLVADEAGLGKTLVARGVVARAIDHLWEDTDRIDVVYVCSNADIARQNINRLNVAGEDALVRASRLTLLPRTLADIGRRRLNFVALTPATSFSLRSSLGVADERALLYWMLREIWDLRGCGPLNLLQGNTGKDSFRALVKSFREQGNVEPALIDDFAASLERETAEQQAAGAPGIRARFGELCRRFGYARKHVPQQDRDDRNRLVGELRAILAATCIMALEPDLVILDEFQRFKYLLKGEDDAGRLAQQLFKRPGCRILLLSATPYKMYTLEHESDTEDHYRDFVDTLSFLEPNSARRTQLEKLLQEYRRELFWLDQDSRDRLRRVKEELQHQLRRLMVRTERLAATPDRNGMLAPDKISPAVLESRDVMAYLSLQRIGRLLEAGDTLEYWKAAPYLLNFMDNYKLKMKFDHATKREPEKARGVAACLSQAGGTLLPWDDIRTYSQVDPGNARLRALAADTVDKGAWRLLWIPPALPYYTFGGPYSEPALRGFTKRLVFSSWVVAPKVIASLLSYEAERHIYRAVEADPDYSPEARQRRAALLRFGYADGRLTGMPLFCLLYPCLTLADRWDPLAMASRFGTAPPEQDKLLYQVRAEIERQLQQIDAYRTTGGAEDEAWYWAAPILLDLLHYPDFTREWFDRRDLTSAWSGGSGDPDEEGGQSGWPLHVDEVRRLISGAQELRRPPADLSLVLAQMALAGPGVAALRALVRISGSHGAPPAAAVQDAAAQVGWAFRNLFNLPEVTALIRGFNREEPYWRRVLEYCVDGNLQATLDEYAHVLRELLGLIDRPPEDTACQVATAIRSAASLRTVALGVDEIKVDGAGTGLSVQGRRMRARFALRFGEERSEDERQVTRAATVREAFNSPFWPFVLATTSVGQEGLDFHPYCHAVVHWNLPSNPVDLEQREGRVHRYKGHAVRKNLARRHGAQALAGGKDDPWRTLFSLGARDRPPGGTELMPYWIYTVEGGAKIERHVPALPLSEDIERLATLRRSLAVYRMVFGQPRQEELLAYLLDRMPEELVSGYLDELQVDLSPR